MGIIVIAGRSHGPSGVGHGERKGYYGGADYVSSRNPREHALKRDLSTNDESAKKLSEDRKKMMTNLDKPYELVGAFREEWVSVIQEKPKDDSDGQANRAYQARILRLIREVQATAKQLIEKGFDFQAKDLYENMNNVVRHEIGTTMYNNDLADIGTEIDRLSKQYDLRKFHQAIKNLSAENEQLTIGLTDDKESSQHNGYGTYIRLVQKLIENRNIKEAFVLLDHVYRNREKFVGRAEKMVNDVKRILLSQVGSVIDQITKTSIMKIEGKDTACKVLKVDDHGFLPTDFFQVLSAFGNEVVSVAGSGYWIRRNPDNQKEYLVGTRKVF
jgi:hypothetical protein